MKFLLIITQIILVTLTLSCGKQKTLKSIKIITTELNNPTAPIDTSVEYYDRKGRLTNKIKRWHTSNKLNYELFEFDTAGNTVTIHTNFQDGQIKHSTHIIYDSLNNAVSQKVIEDDSIIYKKHHNILDLNGRLIKSHVINSNDSAYFAKKYNDQGLVFEIKYFAKSRIYKTQEYKYDSNKNLIEYYEYDPDKRNERKTLFIYKNNKLISYVNYWGDIKFKEGTYFHDNDLIVKEVVHFPDDEKTIVATYHYEYW